MALKKQIPISKDPMAEATGARAPDNPPAADPDAPATPQRGEALGCGWGCGTVVAAAIVGAGLMVSSDSMPGWLGVLGTIAALMGVFMRFEAGSQDRAHHRREAAPRLPVALATPGAVVWITGEIDCPQPVILWCSSQWRVSSGSPARPASCNRPANGTGASRACGSTRR